MDPDDAMANSSHSSSDEGGATIDDTIHFREATILDRALIGFSTFLIALVLLFVSIIVVVRQIPGLQFTALNSLSRYLFIVTIFFGAAIASYNQTHIKIDYFIDKIGVYSPHSKIVIEIAVRSLVILFIVVIIVGAYQNAIGNFGTHPGDSTLITLGQIYLAITIGFLIMIAYEFIILAESFRELSRIRGDNK